MTKSYVLPAVAQTIVLSTCSMIIYHHLWTQTTAYFTNSQTFSNWTQAIENVTQAKNNDLLSVNITSAVLVDNNTLTNNNFTLSGNSTSSGKFSATSEKSFSKSDFPFNLILLCILTPLNYYWQIWLEKTFPGRLRVDDLPLPPKASSLSDYLDDKEEAIVQKWIAQGKVKRASLNWWNTFIKWILDLSLGSLWVVIISLFYEEAWKDWTLKFLRKNTGWIKWEILLRFLWSFVGVRPLNSLVSFIIIPAHQRIVFLAGIELISTTFFGLFVKAVLPWIEKTEFVEIMVANMTSEAARQQEFAAFKEVSQQTTLVMEEL